MNAPLTRVASQRIACARSRSFTGSQVVKTRVMFGNAPASPAPKSPRVIASDHPFHAQPVAAVKKDHHSTIRISTRRGPMRSPSQPPGISKTAYAQPNADSAQPSSIVDRPSSLRMLGAATPMPTRSI